MAIKEPEAPVVGAKRLQAGALGLVGNVVIGLAAVAPAYSLAATHGYVVLEMEDKSNLPALHRGSYSGRYGCATDRGAA